MDKNNLNLEKNRFCQEYADEAFIIENWDLLSEETQKMLKLVGVSPNGNK